MSGALASPKFMCPFSAFSVSQHTLPTYEQMDCFFLTSAVGPWFSEGTATFFGDFLNYLVLQWLDSFKKSLALSSCSRSCSRWVLCVVAAMVAVNTELWKSYPRVVIGGPSFLKMRRTHCGVIG